MEISNKKSTQTFSCGYVHAEKRHKQDSFPMSLLPADVQKEIFLFFASLSVFDMPKIWLVCKQYANWFRELCPVEGNPSQICDKFIRGVCHHERISVYLEEIKKEDPESLSYYSPQGSELVRWRENAECGMFGNLGRSCYSVSLDLESPDEPKSMSNISEDLHLRTIARILISDADPASLAKWNFLVNSAPCVSIYCEDDDSGEMSIKYDEGVEDPDAIKTEPRFGKPRKEFLEDYKAFVSFCKEAERADVLISLDVGHLYHDLKAGRLRLSDSLLKTIESLAE